MEYLYCTLIGYLLGSLSPSALISKIKKKSLRENGTKNLGATNAMLVFGKAYGALVMVLDVAKSFIAVVLCKYLFPYFTAAGILAGATAVLGHIFPFYLKFKGGKGLAAFAGMILALDPILFIFMLILCVGLIIIVNHSVAAPFTASVVFPVFYCARNPEPAVIVIAILVSLLLALRHIPDIVRAKQGGDSKIRDFIKEQRKK